jgi:hypothetical protein
MARRRPPGVQGMAEKLLIGMHVRSAFGEPGLEQQAKAMVKKIRESERRRLVKRSYRGRSDVYRYIRENLSAFQADGFGTSKGPSWDELAETVNREGYTNQRGERVSGDAIRKIFARAVRDACLEPPLAPPPTRSRQRSDWQPPLAHVVPPSTPRASPPPTINPIPSREGDEHLPAEVRAKLAAIDSQFEYLDRHIIRPTKRG